MTAIVMAMAMVLDGANDDAVATVRSWLGRNVRGPVSSDPYLIQAKEIEDVTFAGGKPVFLRIREFPVQVTPPVPLGARNLFLVRPDGTVRHYKDLADLDRAMVEAEQTWPGPGQAEAWTAAYLHLARELASDGMYRWEDVKLRRTMDGDEHMDVRASSASEARAGDEGSVTVDAHFRRQEGTWRLEELKSRSDLRPGVRPICQSTLLLDANPRVRLMAERDLLIMGRAALPYLTEQRAKLSPALRREVDRVIARIERGDR